MKMKKIFYIAVALCLISLCEVHAQWGIAVGLDGSTVLNTRDANFKPGFHAGVTYDLKKFSDRWYFQSGLLFTSGGWTLDNHTISLLAPLPADVSDYKTDMYFLEVPMNFSCRIPVKRNCLRLDAGPYFRYGLFGEINFKLNGKEEKGASFDDFARIDLGSNLGIGLEIKNKYLINAAWQISLTNARTRTNTQHMRYRIGLGYLF
jgi:hypothetical protein